MITELAFIRTYNNFWKTLFPGSDDYIRLINSGLTERFEKPISIEDVPSRRALINSIAFSIFEKFIEKEISTSNIDKLNPSSLFLKKTISAEIKNLANLNFGEKISNKLSNEELAIIKIITKRLINRYASKVELITSPLFSGCGLLFESKGDIIHKNTLVEIKAGQRSFSVQDLRQLFVYLALNHQSKEYKIKSIELCNPRTGFYWTDKIDIVSENISGASSIEIFNEIISFISNDNRSL